MYTDQKAISILNILETTLKQCIHLIKFLIISPNPEIFLRNSIYNNLCRLEPFFVYFLYHLPISNNHEFKDKVNHCLTHIYEYKILFSRRFDSLKDSENKILGSQIRIEYAPNYHIFTNV